MSPFAVFECLPYAERSPFSAVSAEVTIAGPKEVEGNRALIRRLGDNGMKRISSFRRHYSRPWGDCGQCTPFSEKSLERMYSFLAVMPAMDKTPSVFLSDDGNLELCWRDPKGELVSLEFGGSEIEYFIEGLQEEGRVPYEQNHLIVKKLLCL